MKAIEIRDAFGPDHLALTERPDPRPGLGEVLVRVRAASLNYRDLLTVRCQYNPKQKLPIIHCSDGAGEVVEGESVTRVKPGEWVCASFAQRWIAGTPTREKLRSTLGGPLDGILAELVVLDEPRRRSPSPPPGGRSRLPARRNPRGPGADGPRRALRKDLSQGLLRRV